VKAVRRMALLCATAFLALTAVPAGATSGKVSFNNVTVTAAASGKNSAVVMSIVNNSRKPISLLSVTARASGMSMIYYDDNMCEGDNMMTWLSNILIIPGHTQKLGYRYQGAMLGNLRQALVKGAMVPLTIRWSDFQKVKTATVEAKVVVAPAGLRFHLSPMSMKM
jgi:copper(I)-binding protein